MKNQPKTLISIDPGSSGSIAIFQNGELTAIYDMPKMANCTGCAAGVCEQKHLKKELTEIDSAEIGRIISGYVREPKEELELQGETVKEEPGLQVVVEKVWGSRGDTPKTAFRLGQAFQAILTVCQVYEIPLRQVAAITWKTALGLTGLSKEQTTEYASELFRHVEFYTKRGRCLDGRGDAALIGYYAINNL